MKKTITLILLFISGAISQLHAQYYIGPRIGMNFSNFVSNHGNYKLNSGVNIAVANKLMLGNNIALRFEPSYTMAGANNQSKDSDAVFNGTVITRTSSNDDIKIKINYAQLPVMFQVGTRIFGERVLPYDDNDPYIDVHGVVGIYVGYFLSGTQKGSTRTTRRDIDETNAMDSTYPATITPVNGSLKKISKIDAGLVAGIGFTFNLGYSNQIIFNMLYNRGFINVNDGQYSVVDRISGKPVNYNMFNQVFQLNLAYVVRLGRNN